MQEWHYPSLIQSALNISFQFHMLAVLAQGWFCLSCCSAWPWCQGGEQGTEVPGRSLVVMDALTPAQELCSGMEQPCWGWQTVSLASSGQSCSAPQTQLQPLPGTWRFYLLALSHAWADLTASNQARHEMAFSFFLEGCLMLDIPWDSFFQCVKKASVSCCNSTWYRRVEILFF